MPRPLEVRLTTMFSTTSEDILDLEENSSSTMEPPKPPLLQTQWFPGEGILPLICNKELKTNLSEKYVIALNGTVMISVVTKDPHSAAFVVNRINQAKLISGSFTIGESHSFAFDFVLRNTILITYYDIIWCEAFTVKADADFIWKS